MISFSPTSPWCLSSLAFTENEEKDSRKSGRECFILVPSDHPLPVSFHILPEQTSSKYNGASSRYGNLIFKPHFEILILTENLLIAILVLFAFDFWLARQVGLFITFSAAAIIIFRGELAVLMGFILIGELLNRRISVSKLVILQIIYS